LTNSGNLVDQKKSAEKSEKILLVRAKSGKGRGILKNNHEVEKIYR
jgi:hypothetical protein